MILGLSSLRFFTAILMTSLLISCGGGSVSLRTMPSGASLVDAQDTSVFLAPPQGCAEVPQGPPCPRRGLVGGGVWSGPGIATGGYTNGPGISTGSKMFTGDYNSGPNISSGAGIKSGGYPSGPGISAGPGAVATGYNSGPGMPVGPGINTGSYGSGSGISTGSRTASAGYGSGPGIADGPSSVEKPSGTNERPNSSIANSGSQAATSIRLSDLPYTGSPSNLQRPNTKLANPPGVVFISPALPIDKAPQNTSNCVLFLRDDLGVHLPYGLSDWSAKMAIVNSSIVPQKGDVAIIPYKDGNGNNIGHVALVTNVTSTSITIAEANFRTNPTTGEGIVTGRIATGANIGDAARKLNVYGFYRPPVQ